MLPHTAELAPGLMRANQSLFQAWRDLAYRGRACRAAPGLGAPARRSWLNNQFLPGYLLVLYAWPICEDKHIELSAPSAHINQEDHHERPICYCAKPRAA